MLFFKVNSHITTQIIANSFSETHEHQKAAIGGERPQPTYLISLFLFQITISLEAIVPDITPEF